MHFHNTRRTRKFELLSAWRDWEIKRATSGALLETFKNKAGALFLGQVV